MEKKYEIPEVEEIKVQVEASVLTSGSVDDFGGGEEPDPQP